MCSSDLELIPVFLAAFFHHLRYQRFIRILRIKELFNCPKLFGEIPRIFLFHTIDEMLEVIAVPFSAETFHDLNPVSGVLFPVFRELVDTPFPLTEIMGTDIVQLIVINVNFPTDNFEPYRFESIIPWNRIPA